MEGVEGANGGGNGLLCAFDKGMVVVLVSLLVTQGFGEVGVGLFETQKQM